jgi:hypothetical protein
MKAKSVWLLSIIVAFCIAKATVMAAPCETGAVLDHVVDTYGKDTAIAASRKNIQKTTIRQGPLSGQEIEIDKLKNLAEHLPGTPQSNKLIRKEGKAHVFHDVDTMETVVREISDHGEYTGNVRGWDRYSLEFPEPVGKQVRADGSELPLHVGELKIKDGKYHPVPRTKTAQ